VLIISNKRQDRVCKLVGTLQGYAAGIVLAGLSSESSSFISRGDAYHHPSTIMFESYYR